MRVDERHGLGPFGPGHAGRRPRRERLLVNLEVHGLSEAETILLSCHNSPQAQAASTAASAARASISGTPPSRPYAPIARPSSVYTPRQGNRSRPPLRI